MSYALHPTPTLATIVRQQARAVGLASRSYLLGLLGVSVCLEVAALGFVMHNVQLAHRGEPHSSMNMGFAPEVSVIIAAVAVFLPFFVWIDEDPTRRAYHWMMPTDRPAHSILKVLGGWFWLMIATAVFVVAIVLSNAFVMSVQHLQPPPYEGLAWWHYLVPFTAATVFYIFGSAAAVGAQKPIVWLFGIPFLYVGMAILAGQLGFRNFASSLDNIWNGAYGAHVVVGQTLRYSRVRSDPNGPLVDPSAAPAEHWLAASALWAAAAILLLMYTARLRREAR